MGKRNSILTKAQRDGLPMEYASGLSTTALAKKYGVYSNAIRGLLLRRGVRFRSTSDAHKKYEINETYFDDINTPEKAYILGLFYADGSNNEKKNYAYIQLAETDKDILLKINSIITPDRKLFFENRNDKNQNHQNVYRFQINNKYISERLAELGCMTNKTHKITFPEWLNTELYSHFIRGYFDGDGHIGIYNYTKYDKAQFSIVGTEAFCSKVSSILRYIKINTNTISYSHTNVKEVRVGGNRQIQKLLDWMYKDSEIHMNRKYNKYRELIEINRRQDEKKTLRSLG